MKYFSHCYRNSTQIKPARQ